MSACKVKKKLSAITAAALTLLVSASARAQNDTEDAADSRFGGEVIDSAVLEIAPPSHRLRASAGVGLGVTGQSPGGLRIVGEYNRELTDRFWLDVHAAATIGSDDRACNFDRNARFVCDHGGAEGFSMMAGGGLIMPLEGRGDFTPYLRGGGEIGMVSFGADDVSGFALVLRGGAGVSWQVNEDISIHGEGNLAVGPSWVSGDEDVADGTTAWFEVLFGVGFRL